MKKALTHVLLVLMVLTSGYSFYSSLDWFLAPGRKASMEPVQAIVYKKWQAHHGGTKGTSYTRSVLELSSEEGCACRGSAFVHPYDYDHTEIGDVHEVLCYKGTCYHPDDERWRDGHRVTIWLHGLTALVCLIIEGVLLFRDLK